MQHYYTIYINIFIWNWYTVSTIYVNALKYVLCSHKSILYLQNIYVCPLTCKMASFVIGSFIGNLQLENDDKVNCYYLGEVVRFVQKAKALLDVTSS